MKTFSEIKSTAKQKIAPNKSILVKWSAITFVFMFLTFVVTGILEGIGNSDAADFIGAITSALIFPMILANITLVANIYAQKEEGTTLFSYYKTSKKFFRGVWAYLYPNLLIFVWMIPAAVLTIVFAALLGFTSVEETSAFILIILFAIVSIAVVSIWKTTEYCLSSYLISANPEMSVMDSINVSKEKMKGYKLKMILFQLSFIGWFLFGIITLGIAYIWLFPYYNAAMYEFYSEITTDKTLESALNTESLNEAEKEL